MTQIDKNYVSSYTADGGLKNICSVAAMVVCMLRLFVYKVVDVNKIIVPSFQSLRIPIIDHSN